MKYLNKSAGTLLLFVLLLSTGILYAEDLVPMGWSLYVPYDFSDQERVISIVDSTLSTELPKEFPLEPIASKQINETLQRLGITQEEMMNDTMVKVVADYLRCKYFSTFQLEKHDVYYYFTFVFYDYRYDRKQEIELFGSDIHSLLNPQLIRFILEQLEYNPNGQPSDEALVSREAEANDEEPKAEEEPVVEEPVEAEEEPEEQEPVEEDTEETTDEETATVKKENENPEPDVEEEDKPIRFYLLGSYRINNGKKIGVDEPSLVTKEDNEFGTTGAFNPTMGAGITFDWALARLTEKKRLVVYATFEAFCDFSKAEVPLYEKTKVDAGVPVDVAAYVNYFLSWDFLVGPGLAYSFLIKNKMPAEFGGRALFGANQTFLKFRQVLTNVNIPELQNVIGFNSRITAYFQLMPLHKPNIAMPIRLEFVTQLGANAQLKQLGITGVFKIGVAF